MPAATSSKPARLFASGGSQAVRLPVDFRFAGNVVYVRRDLATGDVILSARAPYAEFVAVRDALGPPDAEFLSEAERAQMSDSRDPFAGMTE